jgi:dUTP pyrophosphatase
MLRVQKLSPDAKLPTKAHAGDLGYDLFCLEDTVVKAGDITLVRTGIACGFPEGYGGLLRDRSSMATKTKITIWAGVIDNEYTGEIKVAFFNPGRWVYTTVSPNSPYALGGFGKAQTELRLKGDVELKAGDKIAQMILIPTVDEEVMEVDTLDTTVRGNKGFGSTGT